MEGGREACWIMAALAWFMATLFSGEWTDRLSAAPGTGAERRSFRFHRQKPDSRPRLPGWSSSMAQKLRTALFRGPARPPRSSGGGKAGAPFGVH